ncbi:MAG TPA: ABC transporter permease [Tepidiformaceae bacterium]|nr:ABC transporter permease [Tepidiformaceae bacterium]
MAIAQGAPMSTSVRVGTPAVRGFQATLVSEIKNFWREPSALAFTLGQPFLLLLILNTFDFHVTLPNGEERPYLDRLLPGLIAFNGLNVGLNSIAFTLSRYKERGVLRRIRATPVPTYAFLGGVIVSRLIIALAVTLITYLSGVYIFGAELEGSGPLLVAMATLGSLSFVALGILMVAVAKREDDIPPLFILILMPSMLFSGAFLDRSGLPDWLHWITNGLPLTFLTNAVQEIANLGGGVGDITTDILGLVIWGVAATAIASWRFRMA